MSGFCRADEGGRLKVIRRCAGIKFTRLPPDFCRPGGAGKPQECLLPFKVLPRHMAAKRQGKV